MSFRFPQRGDWKDILIAELDALGYDSFEEQDEGLKAYIRSEEFQPGLFPALKTFKEYGESISYSHAPLEDRNWNAIWEAGFAPVEIAPNCRIRAPFHEAVPLEYELVIQPKMSFGTGHHPTTFLMSQYLLEEDFQGKRTLDMGSGTGVLAILAEKRGASQVDAVDIDPWCIENATENIGLNDCNRIRVFALDEVEFGPGSYDRILANINKNVLMEQLPSYARLLSEGGALYLSGFYTDDMPDLDAKASEHGLVRENYRSKDNWVSAKYVN